MSHLESNTLLEEARHLLPWYLTDKLSKAEQALVNRALELFPELQSELRQEEKMMRLVCTNTSLLELSALDTTEQRLNKLLARIDREEDKPEEASLHPLNSAPIAKNLVIPPVISTDSPKTRPPVQKKWLEFLWRRPLFNLNWLTPANAVFAGLVGAQIALLAYGQFANEPDVKFSVASVATSSAQTNTDGKTELSRFLVQFADDAKHLEVCEFLNQWQAHIVSGPNAQSIFTIEMPVAPNIDKVALAESIMQQTAQQSSPVLFLGPQFQDKTTQ
ncbi:hypothetical protein SAMN02745130_02978 [Thiothrix eikelboomii]|uniref:Uncharacterized protein n=1 Tax=Thiothrix eikelboomii TaxID=92487 RepID=A0A1T4XGC9_9GAMM|nr:hypothetical protein [Thiothrix eikelboomii]SKA88642.1 hypothetical protein SAMN02745130_02978 [Thiothrix eikelboomii]